MKESIEDIIREMKEGRQPISYTNKVGEPCDCEEMVTQFADRLWNAWMEHRFYSLHNRVRCGTCIHYKDHHCSKLDSLTLPGYKCNENYWEPKREIEK